MHSQRHVFKLFLDVNCTCIILHLAVVILGSLKISIQFYTDNQNLKNYFAGKKLLLAIQSGPGLYVTHLYIYTNSMFNKISFTSSKQHCFVFFLWKLLENDLQLLLKILKFRMYYHLSFFFFEISKIVHNCLGYNVEHLSHRWSL